MARRWRVVVVLVLGAIACGPTPGEATHSPPRTPSRESNVPAPSGTTTAPVATGSSAAVATRPNGVSQNPDGVPPVAEPMRPILATSFEARLMEAGLDPKALPPLKKVAPDKLSGVMNTFTKALGVTCRHCHEKDFRAPTPRKAIATRMWNDFARGLVIHKADGDAPLYCDSCHQGKAELLDRHDPKALSAWMQANFVEPLRRVDGKEHACATCHGETFEPKIFTKRWK